jgi:hypothetical protein
MLIIIRAIRKRGRRRPSSEGAGDPQARAQGRPDARCTRGLACKKRKEHAHEHTGSAEAVRPSLRNGFTAYFALSLATGFFVTIISKKLASQKLDASIGASGPHDFAVRVGAARQSCAFASTASHPNVRDDRDTPLLRDGMRAMSR